MAKILLVEDDEVQLKALKTMFVEDGHQVLTAADGYEAEEKIKNELPDLIMMDFYIPKKMGMAVLEDMKGNKDIAEIPVILLTNFADQISVKKAKELGAKECLLKADLSLEDIKEKVNKYL